MTYEELKAEAKRQGYNLIPKPKPKEKCLPCPVCGCKQMHSQWGLSVLYGWKTVQRTNDKGNIEEAKIPTRQVHCNKCGFKGPSVNGNKDQEAVKAWNENATKDSADVQD